MITAKVVDSVEINGLLWPSAFRASDSESGFEKTFKKAKGKKCPHKHCRKYKVYFDEKRPWLGLCLNCGMIVKIPQNNHKDICDEYIEKDDMHMFVGHLIMEHRKFMKEQGFRFYPQLDETGHKECLSCHSRKHASEFGKDLSRDDLHTIECKECRNRKAREYNKKKSKKNNMGDGDVYIPINRCGVPGVQIELNKRNSPWRTSITAKEKAKETKRTDAETKKKRGRKKNRMRHIGYYKCPLLAGVAYADEYRKVFGIEILEHWNRKEFDIFDFAENNLGLNNMPLNSATKDAGIQYAKERKAEIREGKHKTIDGLTVTW